jgi:DNA-directed RNA polymerase
MSNQRTNILDEISREKKMVSDGRDRFLHRQEKLNSTSTQNNPHTLVSESLHRVSEEITKVLNKEKGKTSVIGGRGKIGTIKKALWYKDLEGLDVDLLSYIGLTTSMDGVGLKHDFTKVLVKIGKRIEMEHWSEGLREYNSKLAKRLEDKVTKDHSSERYREKAVKNIASKEGYKVDAWKEERRVQVATPVFNAVLKVSGIFDIWEQPKRNNRIVRRVGLTEAASEKLSELDFMASWKEPMFQPMVVEPKDWVSYDTGCYLEPALSSEVTLVRSPDMGHKRAIEQGFKDRSILPAIYALNAIQRTAFTINDYVVDAVEWAWKTDKRFGKFPRKAHIDRKKRPNNWDDMSKAEKKGWTIGARKIVIKNREVDGLRAVMSQDLTTARELQEYDKFWLPHNFDFRGRVYPVPHFSHHRDDHIKAMFTFANKQKLGNVGASRLAVHLATVGDFDKCSKKNFNDRLAWVVDNEELIIQVGTNFKDSYHIWSTADKPFQFLAACKEYVGYLQNGIDYECSLPLAQDGSNSGVQHYSAASRSKADGHLVNLVPSDQPQDIYQAVADKVILGVQKDRDNECPLAEQWMDFGITRKIVKRNTMTYGYSSGKFGFKNQIMEDTMRGLSDQVLTGELKSHPFGQDEGFKAANYLADKNWTAINEVIQGASAGMAFFKSLAGLAAHQGKPVRWITPVGFPVLHKYSDWDTKKIKIFLHDRITNVLTRTQVTLREKPSRLIKKAKSKSAISPNIIHSMDAAHLLLTVLKALENNVKDFFLIHDSFATIPAQTDKMFRVVRESFVEMYEDFDLYKSMLDFVVRDLDNPDELELPSLPEKGDLDLKGVLKSDYCFA